VINQIKNIIGAKNVILKGLRKVFSGNEFIDKFIQETQSNVQYSSKVLKWIPYNNLKILNILEMVLLINRLMMKENGLDIIMKK